MKRINAITLLIIALLIAIIGGGLYWAQRTGRISLFAAFEGWPDVKPGDVGYMEMMYDGEQNWLRGFQDGNYYPDAYATRAQVVVAEIRATNSYIPNFRVACLPGSPNTWPFPDIPCDHWAYNEIYFAKQMNLIEGRPDGNFYPDENPTRAETVVFLVKTLRVMIPNPTPETCNPADSSTWLFADVPCDHWAWGYIKVAKDRKIVMGFIDNNFLPESSTTRRALAIMLYRTYVSADYTVVTGTVTNADTSQPISGAQVAFTANYIFHNRL